MPMPVIQDKQVNVVRCDHVIEDRQAVTLLGIIEPLKPSAPIPGEFDEELPFVAPVGYLPR